GERDEAGAQLGEVAAADAVFLLGENDDGPPLRGLVGERGKLGGIGQLLLADAAQRLELGGLAVAQRDGPGPVEEQPNDLARPAASTARADIASTLKRTRRSMPAIPMADNSAPMVVGIKVTNSATRITTEMAPPA